MDILSAVIPFEPDWNDIVGRAIRVAVILGVGAVGYLFLRLLRSRVSRIGDDAPGPMADEHLQRKKTLGSVITTGGIAIILTVTFMMVVDEVGIPLGPLLATAGIAGLAIGFGAQTLVQDVISGFFILLEDQYAIGDVIAAGGVDGVVEKLNLRTTVLRDLHGTVHVVPNGEIRVLSNKTKGWSRAVIEVGVAYQEDPDRVIEILQELAAELHEDRVFGALLLEPPTVPGVEAFGDSAITIRMLAKTVPLKQWDVARELRRRIKHRFDAEGIEIPFPQRTIWYRREEGAGEPAGAPAGEGG
ncbi:MAG: mechanosensitive ion channel family protein [Gemmatimonadota bacterium]